MTDRYLEFANSGLGGWMVGALGLPKPAPLQRRAEAGAGALHPLLLESAGGGRMNPVLERVASASGAPLRRLWRAVRQRKAAASRRHAAASVLLCGMGP